MAAHVGEGPDRAFAVANNDDRLAAEIKQDIAARLLDLADVTGIYPASQQDPPEIGVVNITGSVEIRRQCKTWMIARYQLPQIVPPLFFRTVHVNGPL